MRLLPGLALLIAAFLALYDVVGVMSEAYVTVYLIRDVRIQKVTQRAYADLYVSLRDQRTSYLTWNLKQLQERIGTIRAGFQQEIMQAQERAQPDAADRAQRKMRSWDTYVKESHEVLKYQGRLLFVVSLFFSFALASPVFAYWFRTLKVSEPLCRVGADFIALALPYLLVHAPLRLSPTYRARRRSWDKALRLWALYFSKVPLYNIQRTPALKRPQTLSQDLFPTIRPFLLLFYLLSAGVFSALYRPVYAPDFFSFWDKFWGTVLNGNPFPFYLGVLSLIGYCLYPLLVLESVFLFAATPSLICAEENLEGERAQCKAFTDHLTDWECYVDRMQTSNNLLEREHLWMGMNARDNSPFLLHRNVLSEHSYILGNSGAGKTSMGIAPLAAQLIRQRTWARTSAKDDAGNNTSQIVDLGPYAAMVIIDLKGDMALFETVRREAKRMGRTFKFFTNELERATYAYNPLHASQAEDVSVIQTAETLLEALRLNHGEGFGRSFYSRMARMQLTSVLRAHEVKSFRHLYEIFNDPNGVLSESDRNNIAELLAVMETMKECQQLNITEEDDPELAANAIYMPDVVENREVVYFWLPAAKENATVREIASLVVYDLLQSGRKDRPTFLIIDEYQRMLSEGFKIILQQARSKGIGTTLCNQTFSDLVNHDTDLRDTVWTNTRFKLILNAEDPATQEYIADAASDKDINAKNIWQLCEPGVTKEDLGTLNRDKFLMLAKVGRGEGYTPDGAVVPLLMSYSTTGPEWGDRERAPWPLSQDYPGVMVAKKAPIGQGALPSPPKQKQLPARQVRAISSSNGQVKGEITGSVDETAGYEQRLREFMDRKKLPAGDRDSTA